MFKRLFSKRGRPSSQNLHVKCRNTTYLGGIKRSPVPDDKVKWEVDWDDYKPIDYTADNVKAKPVWADDADAIKSIKFNSADDSIMSRVSLMGKYHVDEETNMPRNPKGRTGMVGRGLLGRFGPNFAADPMVTRWKRDANGEKIKDSKGHPILELVCIKRKDNGMWAIPGGMVDAGEQVSATLAREFSEEALDTLAMSKEKRDEMVANISKAFAAGDKVYSGYVDDPRNTDNAWMETTAMNFHDETGELFGALSLAAGDDAGAVAWVEVKPDMGLYASHDFFVSTMYKLRTGRKLE